MIQPAPATQTLYLKTIPTEYGDCIVVASEKGICYMSTPRTKKEHVITWLKKHIPHQQLIENTDTSLLKKVTKELTDYFSGKKITFSGPFDLYGTPFQKSVWDELSRIPYGKTATYGQIAARVGNPKASRAIGMANNKNPVAIMIPCHRVVGSNGNLVGYAGGLDTKEWLLSLEKNVNNVQRKKAS